MKAFLHWIRTKNIIPIIIIFFSVGAAGMVLPVSRELFKLLTPFTLLTATVLILIFHEDYSIRFWVFALIIFTFGLLAELIGVNTGLLFGEYMYGKTLGLKVFHTPLIIGVNWFMLVYCTHLIAREFVKDVYFRSLVAAAMMVVYDFALEPAAMYLDMWNWSGGVVPLQNYIAWFIIAFLMHLIAGATDTVKHKNKVASPLFFIQLLFFIIIDIWIYAEKIWA